MAMWIDGAKFVPSIEPYGRFRWMARVYAVKVDGERASVWLGMPVFSRRRAWQEAEAVARKWRMADGEAS